MRQWKSVFRPNPKQVLEQQPTIRPPLKLPLSSRTMRVFQPRYSTGVAWCDVENGGSGYLDEFPVTFTDGGGAGASGIGRARGGVLQCIAITAYGSYTGTPTPDLSAGGGVGAVVTVYKVDPGPDAEALGITDIVWCYVNGDLAFAASITSRGINLQGTLNGLVDYPSGNAGAALAYDGQPVPVAWLLPEARAFGASWRAGYLAIKQSEAAALAGVTAVHFDDPAPDLSAIRANDSARSGGPFDSETLASFRPAYASELQVAGITQDNFNWTTKTWPTSTGNWLTNNPATNTLAPNRDGYLAHLRQGVLQFHANLRNSFGPAIRYRSANTFDPLPRRDFFAWMLRAFDVAMFETETPEYSGASPVEPAQRFTRLWCNIKTCEGAGVDCIPHLQVLRNDETYASTRAMRVAVLKQQIALAYAMGGLPTYPNDIYLYPWAAGQNERWFAKPADGFSPFYSLVEDNPTLFDGTRTHGLLLLACDVDTSDNRAVTAANLLGWADTCLRSGVQVLFYLLGGSYVRQPALESAALRIVDCSTPSAVTGALAPLHNYRTLAQLPFPNWADFGASRLTGTYTDVFAVLRVRDDALIVHIVNCDGVTRSGLTLRLHAWALPLGGFRAVTVRWYEPSLAPQNLSGTVTTAGITIALPTVTVWGILEIKRA